MKTKTRKIRIGLLLAFLIAGTMTSCVSNKKYQGAVADADKLKKQVTELQNQNKALEDQMANLKSSHDKYSQECEAAKNKLATIQTTMDDQSKTLDKVEKKIQAALINFMNKGVMVEYKNGMVYVSMQENLLYKTGSAQVGDEGKNALGALASALNDYPKLKVVVVGNTDSVMFKGGSDNWTLSTERANGIVRILRDDNVDPKRLTSAGRGKYDPVADNSTKEGRAKNRRTDIILQPDLDRIWDETESGK